MSSNEASQAYNTAELVARSSYGKLVAFLAARTGDVASAEDALSEAFAAALAEWPRSGCPEKPEAWLMTVARRKQIDRHRRQQSSGIIEHDLDQIAADFDSDPAQIPDRRLALMFACAHPAIDAGIRAPLMLQAILGLDAAEIASSFLMSAAAMGKRLGRAKAKIRDSGIPLQIPEREELPARLDAVLEAIYAAFSEGWIDQADIARRELTGEAFFLGRLVVELLPEAPEAGGLLALMLYVEARRTARRNADGEYVPLEGQDPAKWDAAMIEEAESLLLRTGRAAAIGRYQLEAALQSAHVHRRHSGQENWPHVLQLYDALHALTGSPVVAINRSLALAEVHGPEAALRSLPKPANDIRLAEYQPYWAVRAELLARLGSYREAERAYQIAIGLERDPAVRKFLEDRRDGLPL